MFYVPSRQALVGLISQLCGDGDRDRMRHDDVTFSQSSRTTYMAGMIGLAAVVADAAMVDSVIGLDVRSDDERAVPGARMGREGGWEGCGLGSRCWGSERWRDAAAPSGMRCHTSQLFAGGARRLSLFPLDLQHVCEQHLLRLASYASPCVGLRV